MQTLPIDKNSDILQNISDTLNVIGPKVYQIAEASNPDMASLNLKVAIVAAAAGILSAIFGFFGFWYSKRTAKNVARTSSKNRLGVSDWLIHIIYRKMAYIRALLDDKSLISQNILRQMFLPKFEDIFVLEDYRNDVATYSHLLGLKNQMQKYDSAIDACINKLDNGQELSNRDILDLLETPVKALIELYHVNKVNWKNYADRLVKTILEYHFNVSIRRTASFS